MYKKIKPEWKLERAICNHPFLMCAYTQRHIPLGKEHAVVTVSENTSIPLCRDAQPVIDALLNANRMWGSLPISDVVFGNKEKPSGHYRSTAGYMGYRYNSEVGNNIHDNREVLVFRSSDAFGYSNMYHVVDADSIEAESVYNLIQCNYEDLEDLYENEMQYHGGKK